MTGKLVAHAVIRILRRGNMPLVYHSYFTKLIKGIGAFIATIIFLNLVGYGALAASLVAGGGLTAVMFGFAFKEDRKSTRLNSSHVASSYAVFGLKKKKVHK